MNYTVKQVYNEILHELLGREEIEKRLVVRENKQTFILECCNQEGSKE